MRKPLAAILFLLPLAASIGWQLLTRTIKEVPLKPGNEAVFVTDADVRRLFGKAVPDGKSASTREEYSTGKVRLSYTFQDPDETFLLHTKVVLNTEVDLAQSTYLGMTTLSALRLPAEIVLEPNALLGWGDASTSQYFVVKEKRVGNLFATRKGTKVFMVMITGALVDDPASLKELLQSKLQALDSMSR